MITWITCHIWEDENPSHKVLTHTQLTHKDWDMDQPKLGHQPDKMWIWNCKTDWIFCCHVIWCYMMLYAKFGRSMLNKSQISGLTCPSQEPVPLALCTPCGAMPKTLSWNGFQGSLMCSPMVLVAQNAQPGGWNRYSGGFQPFTPVNHAQVKDLDIKTKQIEHVQGQPEVCTLFQTCENVGNTSEVPIAFAASIFRCILWFQKKYVYFQIAIPPKSP